MSEQQIASPTWESFTAAPTGLSDLTFNRILDEILTVNRNWGTQWRTQLLTGGVKIQDAPSFNLALSLSRLSARKPSITAFLATLPGFREDQQAHAVVAGKQVDPATSSLFGTVEQRTECVSAKVLEKWLQYLIQPRLPPTVTDRSKRRANRDAKRATRSSSRPSPPPPHRRQRRAHRSPEVARSQDAAHVTPPHISPQEEPTAVHSDIETPGERLPSFTTTEEELPVNFPSPSPRRRASSIMPANISQLLRDPLWADVVQALSATRQLSQKYKDEATEKEVALEEAEAEDLKVRAVIKLELDLDLDITMAVLNDGILRFEEELAGEEALFAFKAAHRKQYLQLASRAPSEAGTVNFMDTAACQTAINELKAKIRRYETASGSLRAAKNAVLKAMQDVERARVAVQEDKQRQGTFRDLAGALDNSTLWDVVDDAVARLDEQ